MIMVLLIGLGLIFGSFINAFVWRIHERRDWVSERSECPHCHHVLQPKDLIPVVSWLLLKGKCRYCHHKIEDTPLPELAVPLLFVISYLAWPQPLHGAHLFTFVMWLAFIIGFTALAIYDLRWFLLPDKMVYSLVGLALLQVLALPIVYHAAWSTTGQSFLAALVLSGIFYVLFQLSAGTWIGGGDVKLAMALGLLAGTPLKSTLLLFVASISGLLITLPATLKAKDKRHVKIPFGPFLILATIVVVLWGGHVVDWYTNLFAV